MISTDETERVRQIAVWSRALTVAECDRVRAGMQIRTYGRGETLGAEGQPVEHWIGVLEGLVKVGTVSPDGKDITFAGMHAGGWFGEGSLLKNECRRYEVVALRPTRAVLLDRATFFWLYENSVPFNQFLITQLNERLGQFIGLIEHARKLDTTTRVARALAGLFNPVLYPGAGQTLAITQEELGLLAGVSRPIANQALRDLERQGLVHVTYGEVTVPDPLALMHLGEERQINTE